MKKIYVFLTLGISFVLLQSGVRYSSVPPTGRTGASSQTCRSCHGSYSLNSNGSVTVTGLPTDGYVPNTSYPFSLNITHTTADRKTWGFSIKAVNSSGTSVGTFSSTNGNVAPNGTSELSHNGAPTTAASSSYTFNNLFWKAPATSAGNVTFYYCAVAGNDANQDNGDYVYTGTVLFTLPIKLKSFTAVNDHNTVLLKWETASEINSNYFEVERSDDAQFFQSIGKVKATTNTSSLTSYNYADTKAASSGGNIFYRLKMVDLDGTTRYSNTVSIKPTNASLTIKNVYPVIINGSDNITVEVVSDKRKNLDLTIIDVNGRVYFRKTSQIEQGANTIKFSTPSSLPKGMIFLKFNAENFQQTESLIVQ